MKNFKIFCLGVGISLVLFGCNSNDKNTKDSSTNSIQSQQSSIVQKQSENPSADTSQQLKKPLKIETIGGVYERYKLKVQEIRNSFECIKNASALILEDVPRTRKNVEILEGTEALVSVETVKGELIVYCLGGRNNKFSRVYLKTPSFANWNALTYSVLNEIVPDFPLCNKSFNMSYSENDR